jgi:hypothetical protein
MGFTPESARKAAETRHANKAAQEARLKTFEETSPGSGTGPNQKVSPAASHVYTGPSDEEIQKRDREIQARNRGIPKVELTRDQFDKQIFEKRNASDFDPDAEDNPLASAQRMYGRPGMALKALSPRMIGTYGMRGYEAVKDTNGDPVRIGNMVLGEIPQDIADRRRSKPQRESSQLIKDIEPSQKSLIARARAAGLQVSELDDRMRGDMSTPVNAQGYEDGFYQKVTRG